MLRAWSFTVDCNTSRILPVMKNIPCPKKPYTLNEQDRFTRGGEAGKVVHGYEADQLQSREQVLLSPVTAQCPGRAASTHN